MRGFNRDHWSGHIGFKNRFDHDAVSILDGGGDNGPDVFHAGTFEESGELVVFSRLNEDDSPERSASLGGHDDFVVSFVEIDKGCFAIGVTDTLCDRGPRQGIFHLHLRAGELGISLGEVGVFILANHGEIAFGE